MRCLLPVSFLFLFSLAARFCLLSSCWSLFGWCPLVFPLHDKRPLRLCLLALSSFLFLDSQLFLDSSTNVYRYACTHQSIASHRCPLSTTGRHDDMTTTTTVRLNLPSPFLHLVSPNPLPPQTQITRHTAAMCWLAGRLPTRLGSARLLDSSELVLHLGHEVVRPGEELADHGLALGLLLCGFKG